MWTRKHRVVPHRQGAGRRRAVLLRFKLHRQLRYPKHVSTVSEIEDAVLRLSPAELDTFRAWFAELDAADWDRQIENDVASGRLDALASQAIADLRAGRCTDL